MKRKNAMKNETVRLRRRQQGRERHETWSHDDGFAYQQCTPPKSPLHRWRTLFLSIIYTARENKQKVLWAADVREFQNVLNEALCRFEDAYVQSLPGRSLVKFERGMELTGMTYFVEKKEREKK